MDQKELWILVGIAIAATYVWRFLGALLSRKVDPDGVAFRWVTCVSYAMLAGLISRMVFVPVGSLTEVPLWIRLVGILIGILVYVLSRRQVLWGVGSGLVVFVALTYTLQ
jgi:branched-subunit amino acid transport protein